MVGFIVDGTHIVDEVDSSEALAEVEEGLLHCVGDGLRLVLHCEVEILRVLPEFVEDDNGVLSAQFGLLLQFLHAGDDLSREPAGFEGLVLAGVEEHDDAIASDGLVLCDVVVHELLLNDDVARFEGVAEDGEAAACAHLFEFGSSEFGDGVADVSEGFVSLELGSEDGEVGEGFEADVFFDIGFVVDVFHIDFIADVGKQG